MPLAEIQKSFIDSLVKPQSSDSGFLSQLLTVGSLDVNKQLYIYRSNINGAHQKVLEQVYPACLNILGEDYFSQLCRAYRFQYPSTDSDLNNYGEYFSDFIVKLFKLDNSLEGYEYLPDLACLEWHWHRSYYVKDNPLFDFEKLVAVDPVLHDNLIFTLNDSFSLHASDFPVMEIWHANNKEPGSEQEFSMPDSTQYFCITRAGFFPLLEELTTYEYQLLKSIAGNLALSQLSEISDKTGENDFQSRLIKFIQKNWVSGFALQDIKE